MTVFYFHGTLGTMLSGHAYLVSGGSAEERRATILSHAKELLGGIPHPDFLSVECQNGERTIGIGTIRELKRRLSLSPWLAEWKVAAIFGAENLSDEAANAMLKLLEEPIGKALIFLETAFPETLLATIRSRLLDLRLLGTEGVRRQEEPFATVLASSREERFRLAERLAGMSERVNILAGWLTTLRSALAGGRQLPPEATALRTSYSPQTLATMAVRIGRIWKILSTTNANPRLALEVLFLQLP